MFAASKTASVSGGYQISRSLRFNSADSAYLNRTPASASNRKTWTWSGWVKRSALGSLNDIFGVRVDSNNGLRFYFDSSDKIACYNETSATVNANLVTTQVFRDVSAWYHIVLAIDTTNATAGDRMRLYINGSEVTAFNTDTQPTQNLDTQINTTNPHYLGYFTVATGNQYMTEINFVDGTQLTPSSFGETNAQTGVWQPKAYSGSYGTNGFYLNFSDNSNTTAATLGKDYSGNGNNWTPNNFSVTAGAGNDSLVDSPTSYGVDTGVGGTVRGNYCTLNPLDFANGTLSNGNLDWSATSGTGLGCFSTFAFDIADSTNQYYWEFTINSGDAVFGIVPITTLPSNTSRTGSYGYYNNGNKYSGTTASAYGTGFTSGAIIGVAVGSGTITFYRNGVSQGAAFTGLTGIFKPAIWEVVCTATANFGQRPFAYTAPSGFKALCTQNLPTPTIGATTATQANKYYDASLYTGNGSNQTITNSGFQPDWVWIKSRSNTQGSSLVDAVRGASKVLISNSSAAEATLTLPITFNSNGFTSTTDVSTNAYTYVAWQWKANGSGSTNTSGSITSTVSASTTSGFSVVTWTNPASGVFTFGHGLGVAPSMVFLKDRQNAVGWTVYHIGFGNTGAVFLNTDGGVSTSSGYFNNTSPTSTVFTANQAGVGNANANMVAYCFAPIAGYSAFGSYTGNGSTDGPFIYCGFRPAYVLIKGNNTSNWFVMDATRSTYNVVMNKLYPNDNGFERTSSAELDLLSNGFKMRVDDATYENQNGTTYIYMAFATSPFKFSLAR